MYYNSTTKEVSYSTISAGGGGGNAFSTLFTSTMAFSTLVGASNSQLYVNGISTQTLQVGSSNITLGNSANAGTKSVSIGFYAGNASQGGGAVALGAEAGLLNQGESAIAIGYGAQLGGSGKFAIGIGYGAGSDGVAPQAPSSIVINATGNLLNTTTPNSFIVAPVRQASGEFGMYYNSTTKEVSYSTINNTFSTLNVSSISTNYIESGSTNFITSYVSSQMNASTIYTNNIQFQTTNTRVGSNATIVGGSYNIALGYGAETLVGALSNAIAIGHGINVPSDNSINIGYFNVGSYPSGSGIGSNTICIGQNIGADGNNVGYNSIVFNASATPLGTSGNNGLFINPVRDSDSNAVSTMYYNTTSKEITYRDGRYFSTIYISSLTDSTGQAGGAGQMLTAGSNGGATQWVSTTTNLYNGTTIGTHDLLPLTFVSSGQIVYSYDNTTPEFLGMAFDPYHGGTTFVNTALSFSTISSATPIIQDYNGSTGNDGEVLTVSTSAIYWKPPTTFSSFTITATTSTIVNNDGSYSYRFPWTGIGVSTVCVGSVMTYDYGNSFLTNGGMPMLSVVSAGGSGFTGPNDIIEMNFPAILDGDTRVAVQILQF